MYKTNQFSFIRYILDRIVSNPFVSLYVVFPLLIVHSKVSYSVFIHTHSRDQDRVFTLLANGKKTTGERTINNNNHILFVFSCFMCLEYVFV